MNIIKLNLACLPYAAKLGRQGENEATQIILDCTELIELYGDGSAVLLHQRCGDEIPYIAPTEQNGSAVTWTVTGNDTAKTGFGYAQLNWYRGKVLAKSVIFRTQILPSLSDGEDIGEETKNALDLIAAQVDELMAQKPDNGTLYESLSWVSGSRYSLTTGEPEARSNSKSVGTFTLENAKYQITDATRALIYFDLLEWDEHGKYIGCRETSAGASKIVFTADPKHRYAMNINDARNLPENIRLTKLTAENAQEIRIPLDGSEAWQSGGNNIYLDVTAAIRAVYPSVTSGTFNALIGRASHTLFFWESGIGSAAYTGGETTAPSFEMSFFGGSECDLKINYFRTVEEVKAYFSEHPTAVVINGKDETYYLENRLDALKKQTPVTVDTGRTPLALTDSTDIHDIPFGAYDITTDGTVCHPDLEDGSVDVKRGAILLKYDDDYFSIYGDDCGYCISTEDEGWSRAYYVSAPDVEYIVGKLTEKGKSVNTSSLNLENNYIYSLQRIANTFTMIDKLDDNTESTVVFATGDSPNIRISPSEGAQLVWRGTPLTFEANTLYCLHFLKAFIQKKGNGGLVKQRYLIVSGDSFAL